MNRLDLNLLVALDALLQERSVTRAAERLNLTQSTMSASLGRLRRHFKDELLYRSGNTYDLTPLAVHLSARTGPALGGVQRLFAAQAAFDVATSEREFVVSCSDYGAAVAVPVLTAALTAEAPRMRISLRQTDPGHFASADDRLRSVDGLLVPHGFLQGVPHLDVFHDEWACVVSTGNETVGDELTLADLSRLPWAVMFGGPTTTTTASRALVQLGVEIDVQLVVSAFCALPFLVAGSDRIGLMPRRLAELLQPAADIRVMEPPFDAGPLTLALWWHRDFERDAEHAWMRERFLAAARSAFAGE